MSRLLLLAAVLLLFFVQSNAQPISSDNYVLYQNSMDFAAAGRYCSNDAGLALVKNSGDMTEVAMLLGENRPYKHYFIGLQDLGGGQMQWEDGTNGGYAWELANGQSITTVDTSVVLCGAIEYDEVTGGTNWYMEQCDGTSDYVLCNKAGGKYDMSAAGVQPAIAWAMQGTMYLVWGVLALLILNCTLFAGLLCRRLFLGSRKRPAYAMVEDTTKVAQIEIVADDDNEQLV
jgi:hypothetical protein